ncbi:hypothetical protein V1514DRAFT_362567 [Lipomyces japonicus]|uniref:uncharacterized protein n=1 Tax=Lipomyces japonicus TaxID=56871 RepID=UPI0034CFF17B
MSPHAVLNEKVEKTNDFLADSLNQLKNLVSSVEAASKSIDALQSSEEITNFQNGGVPGISLLGLKTDIMASYVHDLALRVLFSTGRLKRLNHTDDGDVADEDYEKMDKKIRELIVTDRTILERGIRPLEKKIDYQINKALRAAANPPKAQKANISGSDGGSDGGSDSEKEEIEDIEQDLVPLSFKPRPNLLVSEATGTNDQSSKRAKDEDGKLKKYVPPKINPTKLPFTSQLSGFSEDKPNRSRQRRNQALEEYLAQTGSGAPEAAPSVGSNVLQHGRGGTRTAKSQAKEDRVRGYEEDNFVRLQDDGKNKRKKSRQNDEFMGENWDIGTGDYSSTKRKKKSVWDRNR